MDGLATIIRRNGWIQGTLVPAALFPTEDPDFAGDGTHLLCVTQSCDLIHHDFGNEPYATFLVLRAIPQIDPMLANGFNPRRIHVADAAGRAYEANAWEQLRLDRQLLAEHEVEDNAPFDEKVLRLLFQWLGKRYTRTAFPDAFNERLRLAATKIRNALKSTHTLFSDLLIRVHPFGELPDDSIYEVVLYLMMEEDDYADEEKLRQAGKIALRLETVLGDAPGVLVVECAPVSENELTLAEFKRLLRWDYEFLSYRTETGK